MIADGRLDGTPAARAWSSCRRRRSSGPPRRPHLTPMQTSDAEDALGDWLDERGHRRRLGPRPDAGRRRRRPGLAGTGRRHGRRRRTWSRRCAGSTYTIDTELLMGEIDDSVTRISGLVARGQAVLAAGPRAAPDSRRARPARRHPGHAQRQDPQRASRWSRSTTGRCRRSPATPPS